MKILVLYRPNSEHARAVETFIRDFQNAHVALAERLEVQDIDSREGIATASLYGIMQHPAILLMDDVGTLIKEWHENGLPLMSDVANYAHSVS